MMLIYRHKFEKPPFGAAFSVSRIATESPRAMITFTKAFGWVIGILENRGRHRRAPTSVEYVRKPYRMNAKNVAFLLGAGCSSLVVNKVEVGIPTMMFAPSCGR